MDRGSAECLGADKKRKRRRTVSLVTCEESQSPECLSEIPWTTGQVRPEQMGICNCNLYFNLFDGDSTPHTSLFLFGANEGSFWLSTYFFFLNFLFVF